MPVSSKTIYRYLRMDLLQNVNYGMGGQRLGFIPSWEPKHVVLQ